MRKQDESQNTSGPSRRGFLGAAGTGMAITLLPSAEAADPPRGRRKKVLVAGGGIGGLCAAFELMERGHDVTVLEASGRTGGHIRTIHDPLPDGLYADVGAEHFTRPGYEELWEYVDKFKLPVLRYPRRVHMLRPIDGRWYSDAQLHDPRVLRSLGFNDREVAFLTQHGLTELSRLYFDPYLDRFKDEYQPFGIGLDEWDRMTVGELLAKDGASNAGFRFMGALRGDAAPAARNSQHSALYRVWQSAIRKRRGLAEAPPDLFRVRGGNQILTDTFTARLGERVRLGCPISAIEHGKSGVTVRYTEFGDKKSLQADYLVCALPMNMLRNVAVTPPWPKGREFVMRNVVFSTQSRVVFQCRTPFWKDDLASPNVIFGDAGLDHIWQTAEERGGERSILLGVAHPKATAQEALEVLQRRYPGKRRPTIERTLVHNWANDPWSSWCERLPFPIGRLRDFWPHVIEPVGRVFFAGAHADNMPWGMDAATRSANRVARAIDRA